MRRIKKFFIACLTAALLIPNVPTMSMQPYKVEAASAKTAQILNSNGAPSAIDINCQDLKIGTTANFIFQSVVSGYTDGNNPQPKYEGMLGGAYKIQTNSDNNFYKITIANPESIKTIQYYIYDGNKILTSFADSQCTLAQGKLKEYYLKLNPNSTYYIVATTQNGSNYASSNTYASLEAISDEAGDTIADNKVININQSYTHALNGFNDIDCYSFTTSNEKAFYLFNIYNMDIQSGELKFEILDQNLTSLTTLNTKYNQASNTYMSLEPNTKYYIKFNNTNQGTQQIAHMGSYKFEIVKIKDDIGDKITDALSTQINNAYNYTVQCKLDNDMFKFSLGNYTSAQVVLINNSNTTTNSTVVAKVQDENGTNISQGSARNQETSVIKLNNLTQNKTYYINVSGEAEANYTIQIQYQKANIIYKLNGGKNNVNNLNQYNITGTTYLYNPTRSGYIFNGWYKNENLDESSKISVIDSKQTGDITVYAKWTKIKVKAPTKIKAVNVKGKKIKVTFKKASGVTGYKIQYSTSKKFTKSKTKTITTKNSSYKIKKLKKNKVYYVKVQAYKNVEGKTYYSPAKIIKVKVKK